jgi:cellulose synthase/poly-beta-1,6-N-acetylglucosamine synthase-like glycosyltransferase
LVFWYWFWVGPALLLALLSVRNASKRARYIESRLRESPAALPPATVIVPVKGQDYGLRENLEALASLDYPDFELIVAARCAADIPAGVLPARARVVLAHGEAEANSSEKVQNLTAAIRASRVSSQMLAFADSDARVTAGWLRALAAPLSEEGVGASTGYRWFVPETPGLWGFCWGFWGLLRSVWDAVSAGMLGAGDCPFAWGGSMAILKTTFFAANVLDYWREAVSDDYALTAAIHAAGLRIAYAPGATAPSHEGISASRFFEWTRRQMLLTRVYRPRLWWPGLVAHVFYAGAMVASAVALLRGHRLALAALAVQLVPGMWKGHERARLARACLPGYAAWFRRWGWTHTLLVPVATWFWLIALASSAFGHSIEWRGRRYRLRRNW